MKQRHNIITSFLIVLIIAGCTNSTYAQKDVNAESTASITPMSTNTETVKLAEPTVTFTPTSTMTPKEAVEATARAIPIGNDYCTQDKLAAIIKNNKLPEEDIRSRNIYINKEKVENVNADELAAILFCQWLGLSSGLDGYRVNYLKITEPKDMGSQIPENYYVIIYYSVPAISKSKQVERASNRDNVRWLDNKETNNKWYILKRK